MALNCCLSNDLANGFSFGEKNELTRFGCVLETLTIIVFSRSGYKDLLGTPKRLLLRPSGNTMIISRRLCGDFVRTLVKFL